MRAVPSGRRSSRRRPSGSAAIAASWVRRPAIWSAVVWALAGDATSRRTRSRVGRPPIPGPACPPIDPPTTAAHGRGRARRRAGPRRRPGRGRSAAGSGCPRDGRPGAVEAGPVLPWQPPSTFGATTNQRSVSIGAPGPTSDAHQPGVGWPGPAAPVTCESPVRACSTSTALSRAALSCPTSRTPAGRPAAGRRRGRGPRRQRRRRPVTLRQARREGAPSRPAPPARAGRRRSARARPVRPLAARSRRRGRRGCPRCPRCRRRAGPAPG